MIFGFSSLGCPDWSRSAILESCYKNQFQMVELHHLHLSDILDNKAALSDLRKQLDESNVTALSIGTALAFHHFDEESINILYKDFQRYLDAGRLLGARYLRVFPNSIPEGKTAKETKDQIVNNVKSAVKIMKPGDPKLGLETHGSFYSSQEISDILERVNSSFVGAVWDAHHTWRYEKESFEKSISNLYPHLLQIHFKDSLQTPEKLMHTAIGEGEFPLESFIKCLKTNNYDGLLGIEYEKKWHPYLPDSKLLIGGMKEIFNQIVIAQE
jgi:sugar phosphate isomerase/epimerase